MSCDSQLFSLLIQGIDPPLYAASRHGRVDIVKCLIRHGADVNLPTQSVRSLMLQCLKCYVSS